jgi:hypothetical protein
MAKTAGEIALAVRKSAHIHALDWASWRQTEKRALGEREALSEPGVSGADDHSPRDTRRSSGPPGR